MGGHGSGVGRRLRRWQVGGSGGRERVAAGGVVVDGGGGGDELAVAVTMFTHVVTATPGSVLTDRCFLNGYGYLV